MELIKDICTSKKKHDELSSDRKIPIESMECYLYTYLNNKYGLKSLVIEWSIAIVNAI